jgi:tetratricopeptide (TPR) repeat protein
MLSGKFRAISWLKQIFRMVFRCSQLLFAPLTAIILLSGCTHTPPGTSVEIALARRPEVVRLPTPATPPPSKPSGPSTVQLDHTELVADAYSRGEFCMTAGKDEEAIAAFREAVKIDPTFADAWGKLAALYEKTGQDKLALEAFKKSKTIARQ